MEYGMCPPAAFLVAKAMGPGALAQTGLLIANAICLGQASDSAFNRALFFFQEHFMRTIFTVAVASILLAGAPTPSCPTLTSIANNT
jgi:hypothetical protein